MTPPSASPQAGFADATDRLAGHVAATLGGGGGGGPAAFVARADDPRAALAAVRVLGPDALAPTVLDGLPTAQQDLDAAADALTAFPLGPDAPAHLRWRDWASALLLRRPADPPPDHATADGWVEFSAHAARLSTLALPGLTGPVHEEIRGRARDLARGLTRALLRRDHPTAARLVRWPALVHGRGYPAELAPHAVVRHLELVGGGGPRTALDVAVARRLLEGPGR